MAAFPKCCIDEVKRINGTLCDWNYCKQLEGRIEAYCKDAGKGPCTPIPMIDKDRLCYCCCGFSAHDALVETPEGKSVAGRDVVARLDQVLAGSYQAGDAAPRWTPRLVDHAGGVVAGANEAETELDYAYYIAYEAEDGATPPRSLLTTVDRLFLRPTGKLTPIQCLAPNDTLVGAHGGVSRVLFVVPARYRGGLHHVTFDGFDNETLDNHLISVNGVVTADYSVQLAYSTGDLDPNLVDAPRVPEDADRARRASKAAQAFVGDNSLWPAGMTPDTSRAGTALN